MQAMLDLSVPLTKVAKSTGLGRKRVAKAVGMARLDDDTAAVAGVGLLSPSRRSRQRSRSPPC